MKFTLPFYPADILLPQCDLTQWAVIACDQFTSQKDYWDTVEETVGTAPSTLRITFPELYLGQNDAARIADINRTMQGYLQDGLFTCHRDAMIYLKRTLPDGKIRHGIVGMIDLEAYDFTKGATPLIRATEGTVLERIPPRVAIRRDAVLELPHIMLLIDDEKGTVIEPLRNLDLPQAYDFDLMQGGGHAHGAFLDKNAQAQVLSALQSLLDAGGAHPLLFAVGDGNHSLATAKTCYLQNPTPENRYALVEVVNIHDAALEFEPIYRAVFGVDTDTFFAEFAAYAQSRTGNQPAQEITLCAGEAEHTIVVAHPTSSLAVGTVQQFLDDYLKSHPSASVDYIHGIDVTRKLAKQANCVGILFSGMEKGELFPAVCKDGALPRKTFSMGEAQSKRYYIEARRIK